jgi:excalibur calcium-binding domain-containing protein
MRSRIPYYLIGTVIVFVGWHKYRQTIEEATSGEFPASAADLPERADNSAFTCDGRTRCREMRSCEEALYFLQKCPGTKMDGDQDGIPCEDQWCSHMR